MGKIFFLTVYGKEGKNKSREALLTKQYDFPFRFYKYKLDIHLSFDQIRISTEKKSTDVILSNIANVYAKRNQIETSIFNAVEKAMLLHILLYGYGMEAGKMLLEVKDGDTVLSKEETEGLLRFTMISGKLPREIPDRIKNCKKLKELILGSRRSGSDSTIYAHFKSAGGMDYRPASVYAYLLGKSRLTEFESFVFFWMSIASLMNYFQEKTNPGKDKTDREGFIRLSEHYKLLEKSKALCGGERLGGKVCSLVFSKETENNGRMRNIEAIDASFSTLMRESVKKWELKDQSFEEILLSMKKQYLKNAATGSKPLDEGVKYAFTREEENEPEENYDQELLDSLDRVDRFFRQFVKDEKDEETKKSLEELYDIFKKKRKKYESSGLGEDGRPGIWKGQITNSILQKIIGKKCLIPEKEKKEIKAVIEEEERKISEISERRNRKKAEKEHGVMQIAYDIRNWYYDLLHCEEEDAKERLREIMLLELPYYYRNNYFHTGKLLPIIETDELTALRVLRCVMEGFLDEKLAEDDLYS